MIALTASLSPLSSPATTNPMQNPTLSRHCIDVGRAMKKVDRTTFLDWAKWCEGVFNINTAMVLWDFFAPISCDVHCASYSQVGVGFSFYHMSFRCLGENISPAVLTCAAAAPLCAMPFIWNKHPLIQAFNCAS
jgi:hypothetical protein